MAIVVKPSEIVKGEPGLFTLDKGALAALPEIANDDYFFDVDNWREVRLIYKTPYGGKEEVVFDASYLYPQAYFDVSFRGRGLFEFDAIYIEDFDHGYKIIEKAVLPASEFEVTIALPPELMVSEWITLTKIYSLSEDRVAS